jgi:hypothetical protein
MVSDFFLKKQAILLNRKGEPPFLIYDTNRIIMVCVREFTDLKKEHPDLERFTRISGIIFHSKVDTVN